MAVRRAVLRPGRAGAGAVLCAVDARGRRGRAAARGRPEGLAQPEPAHHRVARHRGRAAACHGRDTGAGARAAQLPRRLPWARSIVSDRSNAPERTLRPLLLRSCTTAQSMALPGGQTTARASPPPWADTSAGRCSVSIDTMWLLRAARTHAALRGCRACRSVLVCGTAADAASQPAGHAPDGAREPGSARARRRRRLGRPGRSTSSCLTRVALCT